jgi:hypothetical protein
LNAGDYRKCISFVLIDEQYVRNYVSSGVINDLSQYFNVQLVVPDHIEPIKDLGSLIMVEYYKSDQKNAAVHGRILNHLTWLYRGYSSSFRFRRARRNGLFLKGIQKRSLSKREKALLYFRRIGWWLFRHHRHIFENRLVSPVYLKYLKSQISINKSLRSALSRKGMDLVCCPVSVFDYDAIDLLEITKELSIPTLFIADNWDNVSSKTVYIDKPTHFAVIGEQSKNHAIAIQGFSSKDVSAIGSARFSRYFIDRDKKLVSPYNFSYILFTGTALMFDEETCLEILADVLDSNHELFGDVKIVYRPHPARQIEASFKPKALSNRVILDSKHKIRTGGDPIDPMSNTDLEHYSMLLSNAELVVGGLTTMLLEASIFYKTFIALAHDDGVNFTSQNRVLQGYEHLKGIEKLPNVQMVHSLNELAQVFVKAWDQRLIADHLDIDMKRNHFLFDNEQRFSDRLSSLMRRICIS